MTQERFNDLMVATLSRAEDVLKGKAQEYATGGDRMHNFVAAAGLTGRSVPDVAWSFALKHAVSITDMCEDLHWKKYPIGMWREKLGDMLNYLILMSAYIEDEYDHDREAGETMESI